jgi:starch-binding outer membrane protein, SusD/RagB family
MFCASACTDLDIPPKNVVGDETLLTNESGMKVYLARMYSRMPFEDFKYMGEWGMEYDGWLNASGIEGTGEAVNRDGICRAFTSEKTAYWKDAFVLIRDANYLIETLPQYKESFAEVTYNHYLGEAYYARATAFYAMARRFGGVPLVLRVIKYPNDENPEVARSTEEETWDQVLADYDQAISLLRTTNPETERGYANKYIALAFKSEAMLYAGSVAKYNETVPGRLTGTGLKTNVRVMGFDPSSWQSASRRYFREAYLAAQEVIKSNKYSLYKKKWAVNDKAAQYQNMVDMFSDLSSTETIYAREYTFPISTHGYDAYNSPFIFKSPLASGTCPTLDFVELFDGFPRYPDNTIKVTTGNTNTEGTYVLYDTPMDFFKNAEPRLRAYVIFPGDEFRSRDIEIRAGIYTGATPVSPLFTDYSYANSDRHYQQLSQYTDVPKSLYLSPRELTDQEVVQVNGVPTTAAGENGPFYNNGEGCLTGLLGRKWLNPDPAFVPAEGKSAQPYILMRYAEVLLNAAEAGVELTLAGEPSPDGSDMLKTATDAIVAIRERAGADPLVGSVEGSEDGRNIVRKERRKELAMEHKAKWDLRRWRVNHYEARDLFWGEEREKDDFSSSARYKFRGLYPFLASQAGKYFFDAHFQWVSQKTFEYNIIDYYFAIPGEEVSKSAVIDQQPNR